MTGAVAAFLLAISPFMRVARCESGVNPRAVDATGHYYGAFQFDRQTWESTTGLPGVASDYSLIVQLEGAMTLQRSRGWKPWPACGLRA